MPDLNPILVEMNALAARMSVLARSWQQTEDSESTPGPPSPAASTELTQMEIDSIAARLRASRLSHSTDPADPVKTFRFDVAARTAIDLATGILMEQHGINAEAALALLEQLTEQVPVETVAEGVVQVQADDNLDRAQLGRASEHGAAEPRHAAVAEPPEPLTS